MDGLTGQSFDAVIVGAGPAGASLGIRLAKAGKRVLLVEKAHFPRHKLCGEFVSPECIEHFEELGIVPKLRETLLPELVETRFYARNGRSLTISNSWLSSSKQSAIGISRSRLDQILLETARDCGVSVFEGYGFLSSSNYNERLSGLTIKSESGGSFQISAKLAIDASGRNQVLARSFDNSISTRRSGVVAFKTHLINADIDQNACEIYSFPGGYGGCSKVENDRYNTCFVLSSAKLRELGNDRKSIFEKSLLTNRRAHAVLSESVTVGEWLSVSIPHFGQSNCTPYPGVFAIGDAAGFIDPFTGSGIALALQTSKLCANAILTNDDLDAAAINYHRNYTALVKKRMHFTSVIRSLARFPSVADKMIGILSHSSFFSQAAARATRGTSPK
ncbi:MAG: NAD(P)/FAD-dependent oxidoreductase [Pyrinomonadaceae bacterium]